VAIASFRVIGTSPSSCNHRVQDNRFFAKDGSTARMTGRRTSNWLPLITDSMRTAPAGCLAREPAWSRSPLSGVELKGCSPAARLDRFTQFPRALVYGLADCLIRSARLRRS